jgi:hypothetical protein
LAGTDRRDDIVGEMFGDFVHASPGARCTDAAALARKREGTLVAAGSAAQVDKAVFGITAGQKVAKSLFDEVR